MKNTFEVKDELAANIQEFLVTFRKNNPHYPTDPWTRIDDKTYDKIMRDNIRFQKRAIKEHIIHMEEAPF